MSDGEDDFMVEDDEDYDLVSIWRLKYSYFADRPFIKLNFIAWDNEIGVETLL